MAQQGITKTRTGPQYRMEKRMENGTENRIEKLTAFVEAPIFHSIFMQNSFHFPFCFPPGNLSVCPLHFPFHFPFCFKLFSIQFSGPVHLLLIPLKHQLNHIESILGVSHMLPGCLCVSYASRMSLCFISFQAYAIHAEYMYIMLPG